MPPEAIRPRLSVVIALDDHRDQALQAVMSWLSQDSDSLAKSEIVVAGPGIEAGLEEEIRRMLRPEDRFILVPSGNVNEQLNAAAAAARAEMLLFTESHVVAEPGCLKAVFDELIHRPFRTAVLSSRGLNAGRFPDAVERIFDEELPARLAVGWNIAVIRGFFIEKSVFKQLGMFAEPYEHYSQLVLGAEMHRMGLVPRLLRNAWVRHANETAIHQLWRQLVLFGRNEVQFHADFPDAKAHKFPPTCRTWDDRLRYTRFGAAKRAVERLAESARSLIQADVTTAANALGDAVSCLPYLACGPSWARAKALAAVACAVLGLYLFAWSPRLYYSAFRSLWGRLIRYGRICELVERLKSESAPDLRVPLPKQQAA